MPAFHSIEELLKTLSREQRLLKELFAKRKILSFRYEDALALVDYKEERIRKLVDSEVVRENGSFLEQEDSYLQFFEHLSERYDILFPSGKQRDTAIQLSAEYQTDTA